MPTPIPGNKITDFINIVKFKNVYEAGRLPDVLVNYEDIPTAIGRQLIEFSTNGPYLKECMELFDDTELQNAGIYYNKSTITPSGPVLIINSTDVNVNIVSNTPQLTVLGGSSINNITVSTYTLMTNLYLGAGSHVTIIDATAAAAYISLVVVDFKKNSPATLKRILIGSGVSQVRVTPGANYGGIGYDNSSVCANPVTDMASSSTTSSSTEISWTAPASPYTQISIRFKKADEPIWTEATTAHGDFVGDIGFIFKGLVADTYYNFSVTVTCTNGGISESAALTVKTSASGEAVTSKRIVASATGSTLTDPFFENHQISTLASNSSIYLSGTNFTQSGDTITGVDISFMRDQVLIASV